nr:AlpA family phage regulatory protein [uncultured Albidiferax sp.]
MLTQQTQAQAFTTREITMSTASDNALLRKPAVLSLIGISASTFYQRIKDGLFTSPIKIGVRLSGWRASEVRQLNGALIAGQADDEIRELVKRLEQDRKVQAQH